jgi:hypothetical protein
MELKNVIFDMLVEEVRNKKLLNSLLDKWKGENPEITPQNVEYIMTRFMGGVDDEGNSLAAIKDKLNPKKPQVIAFLQRFDGEYGTEKFEPNNLKNIASYSYSQIKSLFLDFEIDLEGRVEEEDPFFEKAGVSEEEKIAASRDMWMGNKHLVYDNGNGFRIYKPRNQKDSISFGYWQESMMRNSGRSGNRWCITWEGSRNMWRTYRSEGRTYYFIIDETKDESDIHFLGVLQPKENVNQTYPFKLTNLNNTGGDKDVRMVDDDFNTCITCIYPQLRESEAQEVLERVPFNPEKEMNVSKDEASRVSEREGDQYEFRRVNRNLKLRYITNGGVLRKIRSFESMDENLIRAYFEQITVNNVDDMFQSYETFKYIINKGGIRRALQDKMFRVADEGGIDPKRFGIGSIYTKLIESSFKTVFLSKQDPDIKIMENKENEFVGILNAARGQWVELNGIKYGPEYKELSTEYGVFDFDGKLQKQEPQQEPEMDQEDGEVENLQEQMDEQKTYVVQTYSKTNSEDDDTNFYVVDDITDGTADVTILSHKTWLSIGKPSFIPVDSDEYDFDNPYGDIDTQVQKPMNEKGGI